MIVLRLPSGGLLAHFPERLDNDLAAELTYLGELEIVITPSRFHDSFLLPRFSAYPGQVLLRSRYADDDSWGHLHS